MQTARERLADVRQVGRLEWIGVRPSVGELMRSLDEVNAIAERGLDGDRAARGASGGYRQVTLIQAEHLPVIAALTGLAVTPTKLRRNLVVAGINVLSLANLRFAVGEDVILVGTGPCAPCMKLDTLIGAGGFQATRGHGGITAQIERGGPLRLGDRVRVLSSTSHAATPIP